MITCYIPTKAELKMLYTWQGRISARDASLTATDIKRFTFTRSNESKQRGAIGPGSERAGYRTESVLKYSGRDQLSRCRYA
jgi:hypothetical protein